MLSLAVCWSVAIAYSVRYWLRNLSLFATPAGSRRPYSTLYWSESPGPGTFLYLTIKSTRRLGFLVWIDQMQWVDWGICMFARWCPKHGVSIILVTKRIKIHVNFDRCHQQWRQKPQGPLRLHPIRLWKSCIIDMMPMTLRKTSIAMSCWTPHQSTRTVKPCPWCLAKECSQT